METLYGGDSLVAKWVSVVACRVFFCGMTTLLVASQGFICPTACGILVSWPGTEPAFSALVAEFLTTKLPGSPNYIYPSEKVDRWLKILFQRLLWS